jgi:hypothetical protein
MWADEYEADDFGKDRFIITDGEGMKFEIDAGGRGVTLDNGEGSIPEGAWIVVEGTELRYTVTKKTAFTADAVFYIPVAAEFAGSGYNIGEDMPVRITRVIPGLDAVADEAEAALVVEGYVHSLGIGGRFEPLALDTVEIITPERDMQADEAGIIAAAITVAKADALKAFNAHFPYLADGEKLAEHGAARHPWRACSPSLGVGITTARSEGFTTARSEGSLRLGVKAHYGSE